MRPPRKRTNEISIPQAETPFRQVRSGLASDIQAFGYEPAAGPPVQLRAAQAPEPWWLFRQDLYLDGAGETFLIVHGKHALSAIRILDVIPGSQTRMLDQRRREEVR